MTSESLRSAPGLLVADREVNLNLYVMHQIANRARDGSRQAIRRVAFVATTGAQVRMYVIATMGSQLMLFWTPLMMSYRRYTGHFGSSARPAEKCMCTVCV